MQSVLFFYSIMMKEKMKGQKQIYIYPMDDEWEFQECDENILPQETIEGLRGLCEVVQDIRFRLLQQGYIITEGKLYNPDGELIYERN